MPKKRSISSDNSRVYLLFVSFIIVFLGILLRLFKIQVIDHKKYVAYAMEQYWGDKLIPAKRGDIISSDGFVLAGTQTHYILYAQPYLIKNKSETIVSLVDTISTIKQKQAENISANLQSIKISDVESGSGSELESGYNSGVEEAHVTGTKPEQTSESALESEIKSKLEDKYSKMIYSDLMWALLERGLTPEDKSLIESKNIQGIGFEDEPLRFYPEGSLASHILGFVASNEKGDKTGYYGVEAVFNEELKGKEGRVLEEKDALGIPLFRGSSRKTDSIPGRDIVLTINKSVQYIIEQKLKAGVEEYDAKSGTVIVMNPNTGEIIAMANYPTFLPYYFGSESEETDNPDLRKSVERTNLAISQTYEPGSVMKPFTVAAGIDLNLISPETTFTDSGPVEYSGYYIDNWDKKHHNTINIIELLQKSNNIGAAWVGHKVGAQSIHDYFINFGFGEITKIDLQGEETTQLRPFKTWTDIDLATISFGQGISTTPIQVINAFNVFANGGYLMKPKIVQNIFDGDKEINVPIKNVRKVVSTTTADTMTKILESAAVGGEAKYFILKDYKIAGKTGTAEIFEDGKYSLDKTNATFIGFLSGDEKISMIVKLEEPKTSVFASETAVPLWMEIMEDLVRFYGIPPDRDLEQL